MMDVKEACNTWLRDLEESQLQQWEGAVGGCNMTHLYHKYDKDHQYTTEVPMCCVPPWHHGEELAPLR